MASQSGEFNVQQFNDLGDPLIGGRLYTYAFGTTTQKTAFTDPAGAVPHTYTSDGLGGQYIALNARGELPAPLYLGNGPYDLTLKTAAGATIWTRRAQGTLIASNIVPVQLASAATVDIGGQGVTSIEITGNTNISSFGTNYAGPIFVRFLGSLTLVHNSVALNLPGGTNSAVNPGDIVIASGNSNNNGWNVLVVSQNNFAKTGVNSDITSLTGLTSPIPRANTISKIESLPNPTLSANAMTLPASTHALDFRSATLSDGLPVTVTGTAAALTIPAGATLGTVSAQQSTLVEVILNNAGTLEKAVVNMAGGNDLSETGVISTTAISAGATAANVFYSNTARTGVAYKVVRTITSTQATAGQWATSPSLVQGAGGNALDALQSLGYGQAWQSPGRSGGVTYYNTTGKPIMINVTSSSTGSGAGINITVGGVVAAQISGSALNRASLSAIVPAGQSYKADLLLSSSLDAFTELR